MNLKELKIKKVTELKSTKVHDLTVDEVQHYITDNGVINHNTGPEYAASIILFLTKAQHKEGNEKTGILVTVKPNKNRFAVPSDIKFVIHFTRGMNKYIGLEQYISWENCGIENGKILTEKEIISLTKKVEKQTGAKLENWTNLLNTIKDTEYELNEIEESEGEDSTINKLEVTNKYYFVNPDNAKTLGIGGAAKGFAIKHLAKTIQPVELFNGDVFSQEVLEQIEPFINKKFAYNTDTIEDEDIFEELEESNEENE